MIPEASAGAYMVVVLVGRLAVISDHFLQRLIFNIFYWTWVLPYRGTRTDIFMYLSVQLRKCI